MIISRDIQNISAEVWTDYFVAVNLIPHQCLSFDDWIKKIVTNFTTGKTAYFFNHKGSYYDAMLYLWKIMTVIK